MCFHDAEVISRQTIHQPHVVDVPWHLAFPLWAALEVITLWMGSEIICLLYTLTEGVRTTPPPPEWRFGRGPEMWLYDEVDFLFPDQRPVVYSHRILFSTGLCIEIPFVTVLIHRVRIPATNVSTLTAS